MRAPEANELLGAWERGLTQSRARRAVTLVGAALAELGEDEVLALPIGRRDATLLALRRRLFGRSITVVAHCPACGETVESTFDLDTVDVNHVAPDGVSCVEADGYLIAFRVPTSADLLALAESPPHLPLRSSLLARCVTGVRRPDGSAADSDALSAPAVAAVAAEMAALDPQADVQLTLSCPACDMRWNAPFDIADLLWTELHAWARRTLHDVHTLAWAYGWREAEVLAMSPMRRQIYLELARP